jgi:hypothetical protein
MSFGFGFIILLLLVGGFAAYQGDRVGMAVGRKRMSIFGLRPKYTSRIVAVFTGIFIVTITMASVLLISNSARISLFGMEKLQDSVALLTVQVVDLEKRQEDLANENTSLQSQNEILYLTNQEISRQNQDLETLQAELEKRIDSLRQEQSTLEMILDSLQERNELLIGTSSIIFSNLFSSPVVYNIGDVIVTYEIQVGQSKDELRKEIERIVAQANQKVLLDGVGNLSTYRGINLETFIVDENGALQLISHQEHINQLVDVIWNDGSRNIIVQVVAASNGFKGSLPVDLTFNLYGKKQVFTEGEVVDVRIFDGLKSGHHLFNELWFWLQEEIPKVAVNRGLLVRPDGTVTSPISAGDLYDTVETIRSFNGFVMVQAVAVSDVYTNDELTLSFSFLKI